MSAALSGGTPALQTRQHRQNTQQNNVQFLPGTATYRLGVDIYERMHKISPDLCFVKNVSIEEGPTGLEV